MTREEAWARMAAARAEIDADCEQLRLRYMRARFILPGEEAVTPARTHPTPRRVGGRPRARRSHAQARSSSRGGDSGDDGPGEPEPPGEAADSPLARVWRALRRGLTGRRRRTDQIRWCDRCGIVAFALDDHQRSALDALGFRDGRCPDCRKEVEQ